MNQLNETSVTIISGTNRKNSNTLKIAGNYKQILQEKGIDSALLSLADVNILEKGADFEEIENEFLIPATHFIIVAPEYNGSFPGVLKLLIDNSRIKLVWNNKKALLTGVATGRAGNLRGLDHLTSVMNHMKVTVYHNKLPISVVDTILDEKDQIINAITVKAINQQLDEFIAWADLKPELPIPNIKL